MIVNWYKDVDLLEIESQKLNKKKLKNFAKSSLLLNNKLFDSTSKIYTLFIEEINSYQILLFNNDFDEIYLECFKVSNQLSKNQFTLFIYLNFFVLYKNSEIYYFQILSLTLSHDEISQYIKNKLNISSIKIVSVSSNEYKNYIDEYKKAKVKTTLININKIKNHFYKIYISYVLFIMGIVYYLTFYQDFSFQTNSDIKKEPKKTKVIFDPFHNKYEVLLKDIKKYNLTLINLSFEKNNIQLILNSKDKKQIYDFLLKYKYKVIDNSISYIDEKKIYTCLVSLRRL